MNTLINWFIIGRKGESILHCLLWVTHQSHGVPPLHLPFRLYYIINKSLINYVIIRMRNIKKIIITDYLLHSKQDWKNIGCTLLHCSIIISVRALDDN